MKLFFYPAITLMNRLVYPRKFTLLGLLLFIAMTILAGSLFVSLDTVIRTSQRQLESVSLIKPISRTVQLIQQHRGLSAMLLGGKEVVRERRAANEQKVVEAFKVLEEKLPADMISTPDWQGIRKDWEFLQKEGLNWTVTENFAAHTHLIDQIVFFGAVHSQDAEINLFYLVDIATDKLPDVLEHMGRIRAYGAGVLAEKRVTEAQKKNMYGMIANLNDALPPLKISFDKAAYHNPALRSSISAMSGDIFDSVDQIINLVELDILTGRFSTSPEDFLVMTTTAIDNSYSHMYEKLLPAVEAQIKMHIAQAEKVLRISVGIAFLLFLVVVYFSVGIYYAIIDSIQALVRSARAFATGDMRERIDLGTHDELKQVGDSFNEMANNLSSLLVERKQAEDVIRKSHDLLHSIVENAPARIFWKDCNLHYLGCNTQFAKDAGYSSPDELTGKTDFDMGWKDQAKLYRTDDREVMESGNPKLYYEEPQTTPDGNVIWLRTSKVPLRNKSNQVIGILGIYEDITERKQTKKKILQLAYYDTLTGLPNRALFHDRLAQEIKKAHRAGLKMALLYIDLDKFKEVNDTLGHSMGDILLKEAACRISDCVREADTVARLGGDEFIIILSELDDAGNIERVAENILQKMAEPFRLGGEMAYVSASMGIALYPDDATESEDLLRDADQAMYVAKNAGRNRLSYFTPALEQAAQSRLSLLNDMRSALAGNLFRVHYQPIVELATGRIHKAEALIRWQHPQRGMVSPAQFIPLAEETGLIVEIGDWVFRETARQVKRWRAQYHPAFQISVNKSPMQFRQSGTTHEAWLDYLQELDLPGQSISIEITEGLLLDAETGVTDKLLEFRDAGMQVSIDDFGTGYSSLSYLKKFDIDYLKIDQSFVRDLVTNPNDMALSEAIIVMAHKLGLKVIAEGVETEAQRGLLSAAGCDYAQGYLFSKPVPAEEFEALLRAA
ncbi:MAG TPA: EAL domain-containing protein [Gallionella sp.]|nr:EAL domain-containing protein [Gallionella sp.]